MRPRSRRATRRRSLITHLNDPIDTPQGGWVPEDEHSTADSMTLRTALRTSSNRAAVQLLNTVGIPKAVGYAQKLNVGTPPSVPSLALGAGDVTLHLADRRVRRLRQRRHRPAAGADPPRRGQRRHRCSTPSQAQSHRAVSEATAFLMSSMLADVINCRHRLPRAAGRLHAAGRGEDRHDQRLRRRLVRRLHAAPRDRRLDRVRSAARRSSRNGYAGELAVPLWASFMKVATKGDKPDWFARPANVVGVNVCRVSGKLPSDGCDHVEVVDRDGVARNAVDGLHRVLREGHAADRRCVRCTRRRRSWIGSPGCSAGGPPDKPDRRGPGRPVRRRAPARPVPHPAAAPRASRGPQCGGRGRGRAEEARLLVAGVFGGGDKKDDAEAPTDRRSRRRAARLYRSYTAAKSSAAP